MRRFLLLGLILAASAGAQTPPPATATRAVFDVSGLNPRYVVGDTVAFRAVNAEPLFVSFCGSVIQREEDGLWANADTLTCAGPPPPRDADRYETGAARLNIVLQPGVFRGVLQSVGRGRFRVVLGARDADGQDLPDAVRATPAFEVDGPARIEAARAVLVGLDRLPPEARALYETLDGFRAIAVGTRPDGQAAWGYGARSLSADVAANRALLECAVRAGPAHATCVLAAVDGPASRARDE